MKTHRPFKLQKYNPDWKKQFSDTAVLLKSIFGKNLVEINHVGSTSIKGMIAKPQIDILAVVKNLELTKECYGAFIRAGFIPRGRYVAADEEYFTKDSPDGKRQISVHTLQLGAPKINDYKIFRDYLQKNKKDRDLYIKTKQNLYAAHQDNYAEYDLGKHNVISAIKTRAKQWANKNKIRKKTIISLTKSMAGDASAYLTLEQQVGGKTYAALTSKKEYLNEINQNTVYLFNLGKKSIGHITYHIKEDGSVHLGGFAIAPIYQNKGYGRKAMELIMNLAKKARQVDLVTHPDNFKAISLYQSLGFAITERKENYYGDGEPRVILIKNQSAPDCQSL
jgi:GrpB-like predicted nucleotidyltransferase (UPF0157 family)/ribosomal protein S18 acetylase RimI-like enzyme